MINIVKDPQIQNYKIVLGQRNLKEMPVNFDSQLKNQSS